MNHKIYARHSGVAAADRLRIPLIKHCVKTALRLEKVDKPCEVSLLVTDDETISWMNNEYRGVESPTDVLSFPMLVFDPPGWTVLGPGAKDPETGLIPLGEIILSAESVKRQAKEYGHTSERETAYLTVHSVLHLLGYDHTDEADGKKRMREREEKIMEEIGIEAI